MREATEEEIAQARARPADDPPGERIKVRGRPPQSAPPDDQYPVPEDPPYDEEDDLGPSSDAPPPEPSIGWLEALREYADNPRRPRRHGVGVVIHRRTLTEYNVAPCENRLKAQFEHKVRADAARAIVQIEEELGPEEAAAYRAAYAADLGAGLYNWDGRHCRTARGDLPGLRYLVFLLLRRCHPDVTEETAAALLAEEGRQLNPVLRWALGNARTPPPAPGAGLTAEELTALEATIQRTVAGQSPRGTAATGTRTPAP